MGCDSVRFFKGSEHGMFFQKVAAYVLIIGALVGTIVGMGMFGLPFVAYKAGIMTSLFYLVVFGIITSVVHLLYFNVASVTKEKHRFTGYVGYYLGPRWQLATFIQGLITLWGTLLLYTILTATFLDLLVGRFLTDYIPAPKMMLGIIFFLASAFIVLRGSYAVGKQELYFSLPLIAIIAILFAVSLRFAPFSLNDMPLFNLSRAILPYGVTLFALSGFSIIPTVKVIMEQKRERGITINMPLAIFLGTLIPAILYIMFVLSVIGLSGKGVTPDALTGLQGALGQGVIMIGALLGMLAIYTSFIAVGDELNNTFIQDYKISPRIAACLTFLPPLFAYVFNVSDITLLVSIVGAIMGGYVGIVVVLLFWRVIKQKGNSLSLLPFPRLSGWCLIVLFLFASVYALLDIVTSLFASSS